MPKPVGLLAGLSALGLLGSADNADAGIKEKLSSAVRKIISNDVYSDYGVRFPHDINFKSLKYNIGEVLPKSYEWIEDVPTNNILSGTSTLGVSKESDINKIISYGKNTYGPDSDYAYLTRGYRSGWGEDPGESIIKDAEVVGRIPLKYFSLPLSAGAVAGASLAPSNADAAVAQGYPALRQGYAMSPAQVLEGAREAGGLQEPDFIDPVNTVAFSAGGGFGGLLGNLGFDALTALYDHYMKRNEN